MEFVLLIHVDPAAYQALSPAEGATLNEAHWAFMDDLKQAGVASPYSAELAPSGTARLVRPDGAERVITDGPFTEAKEQLGGFYVVDVPTIEEAARWAGRIPLLPTDTVEVRPVHPNEPPGR